MDEEKRVSPITAVGLSAGGVGCPDCAGVTWQGIKAAVEQLKDKVTNKYVYFLPSPNKGKRLMIRGEIYPTEAAYMACLIWSGEKTVTDFPEMEEIEIESEGWDYA